LWLMFFVFKWMKFSSAFHRYFLNFLLISFFEIISWYIQNNNSFVIRAVSNFAPINLSSIIGSTSKTALNLCAKRLMIAALKGCFHIWIKSKREIFELIQRTEMLKELEDEDQEVDRDIPEWDDIVNTSNLHRVVDE
jgi:hypothetical protein